MDEIVSKVAGPILIVIIPDEHQVNDSLDLLPDLHEANREEHVYHLRDTHWNARGNRVAGKAMAEHIRSRLQQQPYSN